MPESIEPTGVETGNETTGGSVSDQVAARLLQLISSGEVRAGEKLPAERKLAEKLGVSRVSIRAALQRLKAQGFLTSVQGGGTTVAKTAGIRDPALAEIVRIDRCNLVDLMELRTEIEVWAAYRAAQQASDASIEAIARALAEMRAPGADKPRADVDFHLAIAQATESIVYRHLLSVIRETLTEMLVYHRTELFASAEDDRTVLAHHQAIYDAIADHDPDQAATAMRTHLCWARDHYGHRGGKDAT